MAGQSAGFGARYTLALTRKRWKFAPSKSPPVLSVTRQCCQSYSIKSPADQTIGSVTADGAYDTRRCHDVIAAGNAHAVIPLRKNAKPWKPTSAGAIARNEAHQCITTSRPRHLARVEWISPTKPCRNQDALCEVAGAEPHGAGLRPAGRRNSDRVAVLNRYTALGIPVTEVAG